MQIINPKDDAELLSIDQCMLGCMGYCPNLYDCYPHGLCPLCVVNVQICGNNCVWIKCMMR